MISFFKTGETIKSAPARIANRAVSGSRTVPIPTMASLPNSFFTFGKYSMAEGTVIVTSKAITPPSFKAFVTGIRSSGESVLITATIPQSIIFCKISNLSPIINLLTS